MWHMSRGHTETAGSMIGWERIYVECFSPDPVAQPPQMHWWTPSFRSWWHYTGNSRAAPPPLLVKFEASHLVASQYVSGSTNTESDAWRKDWVLFSTCGGDISGLLCDIDLVRLSVGASHCGCVHVPFWSFDSMRNVDKE
jgi:hypothetical protein